MVPQRFPLPYFEATLYLNSPNLLAHNNITISYYGQVNSQRLIYFPLQRKGNYKSPSFPLFSCDLFNFLPNYLFFNWYSFAIRLPLLFLSLHISYLFPFTLLIPFGMENLSNFLPYYILIGSLYPSLTSSCAILLHFPLLPFPVPFPLISFLSPHERKSCTPQLPSAIDWNFCHCQARQFRTTPPPPQPQI